MSSSENIALRTATLRASSGGTFASTNCSVARSRPSRSLSSMNSGRRWVSSDTPSEKYETVAEMSRGGLRLRRNQRVARSTSLRQSRSILVCVWASTTLSRDSISSHRERMSKTSQAAVYALAISAGAAPVSSPRRKAKEGPPLFTRSLTTLVAVISRRKRCSRISSRKRSRRGVGK
jgi:hypothetical protein